MFASSLCAPSVVFIASFEPIVMEVSSALMLARENCKHFSNSFKYIIKRIEPEQDP